MKRWFEETLGLKTHGESLLSTSARRMINALAIALMIQFMVDLFVWTRVAMYGLNNILFALLGGLAVSSLIYLVDRGIAVMDLTQRRTGAILLRLVIVVVFAFFSAVPLQMTLFEPDIDAKINTEEAQVRGKLIDSAVEKENKRFDDQLRKADKDNETIIATIRTERAPKRRDLLATQTALRKDLNQQIRETRDRMADEMAGQSKSRLRGYGSAARAAEAQVAKAVEDMKDLEALMAAEVKLFDDITEKRIEAALADAKATKEKLIAERQSTLQRIQSASNEELSTKYGGKWEVSRGFLRRYTELQNLKASDATVRLASHACEAIMISLALLVLLLKLMGGQALKIYYSDMAQAQHKGDNLTYDAAKASGYDDEGIQMMSLPQKARDRMKHIHTLRLEVCKAYSKHLATVAHVCSEGDLAKAVLNERIRKSFETEVAERITKLRNAEEQLRLEGFRPQNWSDKLPYTENIATDWKMPDEKLRELGWKDPDRRAAERAFDQMKKLYLELTEVYYNYEGQLRLRIIKDPTQPRESLLDWAHQYYAEQIVPRMKQLAECEMTIVHGGLSVPEPPSSVPSEEELRMVGEIPPSMLAKLGVSPRRQDGASGQTGPMPVHLPSADER